MFPKDQDFFPEIIIQNFHCFVTFSRRTLVWTTQIGFVTVVVIQPAHKAVAETPAAVNFSLMKKFLKNSYLKLLFLEGRDFTKRNKLQMKPKYQ